MIILKLFLISVSAFSLQAAPLPEIPQDPNHPGSAYYTHAVKYGWVMLNGRKAAVVLPMSDQSSEKYPVIVFGNGHAVPYLAYKAMADHLAKKGVAVIFPEYQRFLWDKDFHQMAEDYNSLTSAAFKKYGSNLDENKVIYSGHSYGGLVALMAAGIKDLVIKPRSLVLFSASYFSKILDYSKNIDPKTAVTLVSGDQDEPETDEKIYNELPLKYKQRIILKSYLMTTPKVIADHGLVRTFGWKGLSITPLHYYGVWKFLGGAVMDIQAGGFYRNPYIYGRQAKTTGIDGFDHLVFRSW